MHDYLEPMTSAIPDLPSGDLSRVELAGGEVAGGGEDAGFDCMGGDVVNVGFVVLELQDWRFERFGEFPLELSFGRCLEAGVASFDLEQKVDRGAQYGSETEAFCSPVSGMSVLGTAKFFVRQRAPKFKA